MKLNLDTKDKILNTLLVIADENNNTEIKNFNNYVFKFNYISEYELYRYLQLLEYEHIIDLDYTDERISSILLMPSAFIYFSEKSQSNKFTYINIILTTLTLLVTIVGIIVQFVK